MRARFVLLLTLCAAPFVSACERTSWIRILDVRTARAPDNHVVADVELEAVEQGGGAVGPYCVSIHWFDFGFNPATEERATYDFELDSVEQCDNDLGDGDQRTFRLISKRGDLAPGLPARVQVRNGGTWQVKEGVFAP